MENVKSIRTRTRAEGRDYVTAHHDNSANDPLNPDPDKSVTWAVLTSAEMMLPWFGVVVSGEAEPDMIASYKPSGIDGPVVGKLVINGDFVLSAPVDGKPHVVVVQPAIFQSK